MNALGNCQQCGEQKPCKCASMTKAEAREAMMQATREYVAKLKETQKSLEVEYAAKLEELQPVLKDLSVPEQKGMWAEISAIIDTVTE